MRQGWIRTAVVCASALCVWGTGLGSASPAIAAPGVDTSPQAVDNFQAWWQYENVWPGDQSIPTDTALQAAIHGCELRNQGLLTRDIVGEIDSVAGTSWHGGTELWRSATETICSQYRGFKSDWDTTVNEFEVQVDPLIPWSTNARPPEIDYGWFMRAVDQGVSVTPIEALDYRPVVAWLHTQPVALANNYQIQDDVLLKMVEISTALWHV
jgi:hypothetical protein